MQDDKLKDIITHLRFPFSLLLLPVFLFALYALPQIPLKESLFFFLILHVLVYPSSNGYNSLMDDDKGSIGGIKSPPKVPQEMFWVSVSMDMLALILSYLLFSTWVLGLLLSYILASRAYSFRKIRLKKYPIIGFLTVTVFQGPVVYVLTILALTNNNFVWIQPIGLLMSYLIIAAGYPISQIYQHDQDRADGVKTISMILGVRGTFVLSGIMFALLGLLFGLYFIILQNDLFSGLLSLVLLSPVGLFFTQWMIKCYKDISHADYENTMKMNKWGALSINVTFLTIILKNIIFC
jgi:1,4-dihydroxy-2-naphthoate octaprenyltransferase